MVDTEFKRLEEKIDRILGYIDSIQNLKEAWELNTPRDAKGAESALLLSCSEQNNNSNSNRQWVSTPECCDRLGISREKLYGLRKSTRFGKCGHAWRYSNVSRSAKRPTYQWHITKCQELLDKALGKK
jgi:hypothetical protein